MRRLSFTKRAQQDIRKIIHYLDHNWPVQVKTDFRNEFERTVRIVHRTPDIFPLSDLEHVYKAVVTKHHSLLYAFNDDEITVLNIFDNRLHPKKRKR